MKFLFKWTNQAGCSPSGFPVHNESSRIHFVSFLLFLYGCFSLNTITQQKRVASVRVWSNRADPTFLELSRWHEGACLNVSFFWSNFVSFLFRFLFVKLRWTPIVRSFSIISLVFHEIEKKKQIVKFETLNFVFFFDFVEFVDIAGNYRIIVVNSKRLHERLIDFMFEPLPLQKLFRNSLVWESSTRPLTQRESLSRLSWPLW